ncbi:hypothetical protein B0T22DRAFT_493094 [Podospora appendiculata]|uniref:Uncharacterized protein n=1 Tax=Podospora appendiculata TaxID=314037 RepID=A0AAE0X245_9PEZI|nr:hypothetical protein B0T22DRAFT_493094 [Podospora appendiculata]
MATTTSSSSSSNSTTNSSASGTLLPTGCIPPLAPGLSPATYTYTSTSPYTYSPYYPTAGMHQYTATSSPVGMIPPYTGTYPPYYLYAHGIDPATGHLFGQYYVPYSALNRQTFPQPSSLAQQQQPSPPIQRGEPPRPATAPFHVNSRPTDPAFGYPDSSTITVPDKVQQQDSSRPTSSPFPINKPQSFISQHPHCPRPSNVLITEPTQDKTAVRPATAPFLGYAGPVSHSQYVSVSTAAQAGTPSSQPQISPFDFNAMSGHSFEPSKAFVPPDPRVAAASLEQMAPPDVYFTTTEELFTPSELLFTPSESQVFFTTKEVFFEVQDETVVSGATSNIQPAGTAQDEIGQPTSPAVASSTPQQPTNVSPSPKKPAAPVIVSTDFYRQSYPRRIKSSGDAAIPLPDLSLHSDWPPLPPPPVQSQTTKARHPTATEKQTPKLKPASPSIAQNTAPMPELVIPTPKRVSSSALKGIRASVEKFAASQNPSPVPTQAAFSAKAAFPATQNLTPMLEHGSPSVFGTPSPMPQGFTPQGYTPQGYAPSQVSSPYIIDQNTPGGFDASGNWTPTFHPYFDPGAACRYQNHQMPVMYTPSPVQVSEPKPIAPPKQTPQPKPIVQPKPKSQPKPIAQPKLKTQPKPKAQPKQATPQSEKHLDKQDTGGSDNLNARAPEFFMLMKDLTVEEMEKQNEAARAKGWPYELDANDNGPLVVEYDDGDLCGPWCWACESEATTRRRVRGIEIYEKQHLYHSEDDEKDEKKSGK